MHLLERLPLAWGIDVQMCFDIQSHHYVPGTGTRV